MNYYQCRKGNSTAIQLLLFQFFFFVIEALDQIVILNGSGLAPLARAIYMPPIVHFKVFAFLVHIQWVVNLVAHIAALFLSRL
jgi:hypothetical protein